MMVGLNLPAFAVGLQSKASTLNKLDHYGNGNVETTGNGNAIRLGFQSLPSEDTATSDATNSKLDSFNFHDLFDSDTFDNDTDSLAWRVVNNTATTESGESREKKTELRTGSVLTGSAFNRGSELLTGSDLIMKTVRNMLEYELETGQPLEIKQGDYSDRSCHDFEKQKIQKEVDPFEEKKTDIEFETNNFRSDIFEIKIDTSESANHISRNKKTDILLPKRVVKAKTFKRGIFKASMAHIWVTHSVTLSDFDDNDSYFIKHVRTGIEQSEFIEHVRTGIEQSEAFTTRIINAGIASGKREEVATGEEENDMTNLNQANKVINLPTREENAVTTLPTGFPPIGFPTVLTLESNNLNSNGVELNDCALLEELINLTPELAKNLESSEWTLAPVFIRMRVQPWWLPVDVAYSWLPVSENVVYSDVDIEQNHENQNHLDNHKNHNQNHNDNQENNQDHLEETAPPFIGIQTGNAYKQNASDSTIPLDLETLELPRTCSFGEILRILTRKTDYRFVYGEKQKSPDPSNPDSFPTVYFVHNRFLDFLPKEQREFAREVYGFTGLQTRIVNPKKLTQKWSSLLIRGKSLQEMAQTYKTYYFERNLENIAERRERSLEILSEKNSGKRNYSSGERFIFLSEYCGETLSVDGHDVFDVSWNDESMLCDMGDPEHSEMTHPESESGTLSKKNYDVAIFDQEVDQEEEELFFDELDSTYLSNSPANNTESGSADKTDADSSERAYAAIGIDADSSERAYAASDIESDDSERASTRSTSPQNLNDANLETEKQKQDAKRFVRNYFESLNFAARRDDKSDQNQSQRPKLANFYKEDATLMVDGVYMFVGRLSIVGALFRDSSSQKEERKDSQKRDADSQGEESQKERSSQKGKSSQKGNRPKRSQDLSQINKTRAKAQLSNIKTANKFTQEDFSEIKSYSQQIETEKKGKIEISPTIRDPEEKPRKIGHVMKRKHEHFIEEKEMLRQGLRGMVRSRAEYGTITSQAALEYYSEQAMMRSQVPEIYSKTKGDMMRSTKQPMNSHFFENFFENNRETFENYFFFSGEPYLRASLDSFLFESIFPSFFDDQGENKNSKANHKKHCEITKLPEAINVADIGGEIITKDSETGKDAERASIFRQRVVVSGRVVVSSISMSSSESSTNSDSRSRSRDDLKEDSQDLKACGLLNGSEGNKQECLDLSENNTEENTSEENTQRKFREVFIIEQEDGFQEATGRKEYGWKIVAHSSCIGDGCL